MPPAIDQPFDIKFALEGRVVTMDAPRTVLERGVVYVDSGAIAAVQPENAPAPPRFEDVAVIHSRGTIYPGLIELHNHLPSTSCRCGTCRNSLPAGASGGTTLRNGNWSRPPCGCWARLQVSLRPWFGTWSANAWWPG